MQILVVEVTILTVRGNGGGGGLGLSFSVQIWLTYGQGNVTQKLNYVQCGRMAWKSNHTYD